MQTRNYILHRTAAKKTGSDEVKSYLAEAATIDTVVEEVLAIINATRLKTTTLARIINNSTT